MPSILQLQRMAYRDIADSLFLGGTSITPVSDNEFRTQLGAITIVFSGTGFAYDAANTLTAGTLDEYRVYSGAVAIANQQVIVSSNFDLLDFAELNAAFNLFDSGNWRAASQLVTASWTAEYFSHTNYSGGPLYGYQGGDGLNGGVADDIIFGRAGDDGITLNGGDDFGYGGLGNDRIYGRDGRDWLFGGSGNDILYGDDGSDTLEGGSGNDSLYGGRDNDVLLGGWGADYLAGDRGDDTLRGNGSYDTLHGGTGNDWLFGGADNDTLYGENNDDRLIGGHGDDSLFGGAGNDVLIGGSGDDDMRGGGGQDRLVSTGGDDRLSGGTDTDTFVIRASAGSQTRIVDFQDNIDRLVLRDYGFANAAAAIAAATDTVDGHVRFDLGGGQVLLVTDITVTQLSDDILT